MRIIILSIFLLFSFSMSGQLDVDKNKWAFERTSYKRWNKWKPWWYFNVVNAKYKKEDRRTMYPRARQMSQWAIYWDHYDILQRQTDSTYQNETYMALDRTLNKNWKLFQRAEVEKIDKQFEILFVDAIDKGMEGEPYEKIQNLYNNIKQKIELTLKAYVLDNKKTKIIEQYIKQLEGLLKYFSLRITLLDFKY